ncbi:prepilin peptidase [Candidatus Uhrbacteria bacterium]|nr:prepilin peptidase [Candidatus Uhrbacteria bacterium]
MFLLYIFAALLGAAIGSFIHCVVVRESAGEKWTTGRSECDNCKTPLPWTANLPIIGFLLSGGKTQCCSKPLTIWHLVLETLGAVLFVLLAGRWIDGGDTVLLIKSLAVAIFAIYTLASDGRFMEVSVPVSLVSAIVLLGVAMASGNLTIAILTGLGGAGFFALQYALTRGKGIGSGDMILGGVIGLSLGFPGVVVGIMLGYMIGATHAVVLIAQKKASRKTHVPLGAYLMVGMLIAFFYGDLVLGLVY